MARNSARLREALEGAKVKLATATRASKQQEYAWAVRFYEGELKLQLAMEQWLASGKDQVEYQRWVDTIDQVRQGNRKVIGE